MSVSPFEHPFLGALLGDAAGAELFSADAELAAMLAVEAALAQAQGELGVIPDDAAVRIAALCESFQPDRAALAAGMARDGVIVPELVSQLRAALGEPWGRYVHYGATSQDITDTALTLRLRQVLALYRMRLAHVLEALERLDLAAGSTPIMAQTRMQRALPITAGQKLAQWRAPLLAMQGELDDLDTLVCVLQLGGPVGNRASFGEMGTATARLVAQRLGLGDPGAAWHSDRTRLVRLADWVSRITGALGKLGQDVALMAQTEIATIVLTSAGSSSAMAGKRNPVAAEALVTLARYNAVQVSAMHQSLVHENERSGAAWTLEWLVLPSILVAGLGALRLGAQLLDTVQFRPITA